MDVRLPGMDGVEATRRLSRECPDVRVIATTGVDDPECVKRLIEAGAARFIAKDDLARELIPAVVELAGEAAAARRVS
jgi:DNA-binding NarL/FixJ family response regulator